MAYSKKDQIGDDSHHHYQSLFDSETFQTTTGEKISLKDVEAPLVILNFWASWCFPCIEELPSLVSLRKRFSNEDLLIIGINSDQENQKVKIRKVIKKLKLNFPQVADSTGEILEDYKVEALPLTIFFYRGKVVKINYGAVNFMSKPILKKLEGILEND